MLGARSLGWIRTLACGAGDPGFKSLRARQGLHARTESIGGEAEMTYPCIKPALKVRIKSIIVKEFGGIDHLLDDLSSLLKY